MAKQSVSKKYTVNASGVLEINEGVITVIVEDVGEFRLDELLKDFDGYAVKISATHDEEQCAPASLDVDESTGEIL